MMNAMKSLPWPQMIIQIFKKTTKNSLNFVLFLRFMYFLFFKFQGVLAKNKKIAARYAAVFQYFQRSEFTKSKSKKILLILFGLHRRRTAQSERIGILVKLG